MVQRKTCTLKMLPIQQDKETIKVECNVRLIGIEHVRKSKTGDCGAFVKLKALQYRGVWTERERDVKQTACNSLLTNYWLYNFGPVI